MMEDKQPIIVRLISPARPILQRSGSPLHSIYQHRFSQLPRFQHIPQQDQALHRDLQSPKTTPQRHCYPIYIRNISQTWNFSSPLNVQPPIKAQIPQQPSHQPQTLNFDSNFESGNLKQADKVYNEDEYNLMMQKDVNTYGYTQWFFFKVTRMRQGRTCKFNIVNFYKRSSLYQKGMRVLVYSVRENANNKRGWHRDGTNIHYYQNDIAEVLGDGKLRNYYTLSFDYTFPYQHDQVFFAYNYPYTYTQLNTYLDTLQLTSKPILHRSTLTRTLAGNRVQLLTISNFSSTNLHTKKTIIITGRVHPGQTVSSYITKGVIDYLTSDDENAYQLRDNFVFKIVPMVNPDGVIHGNYRSNLAGSDLNRKWELPSKRLHPEIYALKKVILEIKQKSQILMFCDMHGHSKKKNAFIYGCADKRNPFSTKEFPFLVSKASKSFSFQDCSFGIKQDKRGTARAVLWKSLSIPNVFTLETSFCGPAQPEVHFGYRHFEEIGKRFCETLLLHFQDQLNFEEGSMNMNMGETRMFGNIVRKNALEELYNDAKYQSNNDEDDSDSEASIDAFSDRQLATLQSGAKLKLREITRRRDPDRSPTPIPSRTRRNLPSNPRLPSRLPSKTNQLQAQPLPLSPLEPTEATRTIYRQKLPMMFLQPKVFTIVEPQLRCNNWSYQSYQMYQNKSYSFANKKSFKANGNRREETLASLVVGGGERERDRDRNQERRSMVNNRRHRTEIEFDDKNMTIDFEGRLRRKKYCGDKSIKY